MKLLTLILRVLLKLFGQNALFAAIEKIVDRKTILKLARFDERAEIRELKNDLVEMKLQNKKTRKERKRDKNGRFTKTLDND